MGRDELHPGRNPNSELRCNVVEIEKERGAEVVVDHGIVAWLQVLGAFINFFNTWGIINAFGTFQAHYQQRFPEQSASNISWIGSIDAFLLMGLGIVSGPLLDQGWFRTLQLSGTFLVLLGIFMASIAKEFWQVMLAQGVCFGLGCGCLYTPSVAIVSTYFQKKRSIAIGIVTSGSGFGSVIYSILFHQLQPRIGDGSALRAIGYIALGTFVLSIILLRPRIQPAKKGSYFAYSAFKEPPYAWFTAGVFFGYMGLYIPIDYVSSYAQGGIRASPSIAFYMVPILNAGSIFGRLIPNYLADHLGPINVLIPFVLACGVLAFAWLGIHNTPGLIVFSILYGFCSGSYVSLPPAAVARLTPDLQHVGSRMGTCFLFAALGILIGSPVAGQLVTANHTVFWRAEVFCGGTVFVSLLCTICARVANAGFSWRYKT
ncbi:hypothetical protein MYAM1_002263 [Malassezia yamatoensis]|uniref:Major facilitator superfamily (MFS) profile domain-containing protein n=1 Tax=Malassezia yamatoensis TaxID=253288 RepID=A0AAJ5YUI4_9BASI|nr:hypothetical protein MYAM1_002263 [Malassezia yamatoensis]